MSNEQGFINLVKRVREIDSEAADWLEQADKPNFCNFHHEGNLAAAMVWGATPQGYDFWSDISLRLGRRPISELDRVRQQRDDLVAALERIERACEPGSSQSEDELYKFIANIRKIAHAVLAKAQK